MTSAKPQFSDWARYPAAVVVALIASVATGILYGMLCFGILDTTPILSLVLPLLFAPLVGFNGVFFGSLCFKRSKRVFGSKTGQF
jgi:ABC-type polysaccharide/polyol phosphate export permease